MISVTVTRQYLPKAPRKVRAVLDMIRKKNALSALEQLEFVQRGPAKDIATLLKSGIAAAKLKDADENKLIVKAAMANEGPSLKRRWLRAKGQATMIKKTMSHVIITVSDEPLKLKKQPRKTKSVSQPAKKKASQ
jgi:large subunit ribosomal protein L22